MLGWNGGFVGGWIADGLRGLIGAAAYAAPVALVVVGVLMLARSDARRPAARSAPACSCSRSASCSCSGARTAATSGRGLDGDLRARSSAAPARRILGVTALVAGVAAAHRRLDRRAPAPLAAAPSSARRAVAQRRLERPAPLAVVPRRRRLRPDAEADRSTPSHDYPDVVGEADVPSRRRSSSSPTADEDAQPSLFDVTARAAPDYRLPDREILRRSPPAKRDPRRATARASRRRSSQTLAHFGVEATSSGRSPARA